MARLLKRRANPDSGPPGKWSEMVRNGEKMVFWGVFDDGHTQRSHCSRLDARIIRPGGLIPLFWSLEVQSCHSTAMPLAASSFFAVSFLARRVSFMPRRTLGALVNWILS